jgi:hypothetical protein
VKYFVREEGQMAPIVGIQYLTWFDYTNPGSGCSGNGWADHPFKLLPPNQVRSMVFDPSPDGFCYSSADPHTGSVHARFLNKLGVSFVIFDESNFSKSMDPSQNPTFRTALKAMEGLRQYNPEPPYAPRRIRAAFQLSITCWASQCWGQPSGDDREIFTFNDHVKAHIVAIANAYRNSPDDFQLVAGKPLLLFYVSQGSNVILLNGSPAFHGPGNITPTTSEFDYVFQVGGSSYHLRDFFTVRFAVVAAATFDYRPYGVDIWPFTCATGDGTFSEVGYASLFAPAAPNPCRDFGAFSRMVDAAQNKDYLIIRSWNEFSSTDECAICNGKKGQAYTIEPNTQMHKYDTTPGNQDPWYFFNCISGKLNPPPSGGAQQ